MVLAEWLARSRMHRNVVNSRIANIFKRICNRRIRPETERGFAKMRRRKMCGSCVYHAGVNHAARSSGALRFVSDPAAAQHVTATFYFKGRVRYQRAELLTALASSPRRRIGAQQNEQANPLTCPSPHGRGDARICAAGARGPIFHSAGPGENRLGERASFSSSPVFPPRGSRLFNRSAIHWKVT